VTTLPELQHAKSLFESSTVDLRCHEVVLPTSLSIQSKLNEMDEHLLESRLSDIRTKLTTTVNERLFTLTQVISEYRCIPTGNVLSFTLNEDTGASLTSSKTYHEINEYFTELESLTDIVKICAYISSIPFNSFWRNDAKQHKYTNHAKPRDIRKEYTQNGCRIVWPGDAL
jgi:hypothetical protein